MPKGDPARRAASAASRSTARTCLPATGGCRTRRARNSPPTPISGPATSASCSPNGYLRIVGRAKDLIITGGLNVYPKEIEEKIDALPGVVESAVIGVPDADFGEAVAAVVVAHPGHALTEAGVIGACGTRSRVSRFRSACSSSTELPRNAMGKVQKNVLRERFAKP